MVGCAEAGSSRSALLAVVWKELNRYSLLHTVRDEIDGGEEGEGVGGVTSSVAPGYLSKLVGHELKILIVTASTLD
jgi:hypothetical protein